MANTSSGALLSPLRYDPLQLHEDPYPLYRRLRDEAPVYRSEERDCWVLSRYEDVRAAARDWETFRNGDGNTLDKTGELFAPAGEVTHADPPIHGRLRDAVRKEFGVSKVRAQLEPVVRAKVRRLIGDLRGREQVDFAEDLALVLPGGMVCGWLGFPERDHAQLLEWFGTMVERTPGQVELPAHAFVGRDLMRAYLKDAIAARRGSPRQDLLSTIVGAVEDERLSEDEAIGISMLLFFAGIATTSALIASSLLNLSEFKPQLQQLRDAPETIPAAVEELLRFDAPIQWLTRVTNRDVELRGTSIPADSRVLLVWGSANRDERRWERPDELDLAREPQRHISFGEGIHHCLGAPLARLEARVLLEELLPQIADYEITGPVQRPYTEGDRAISSLPARVEWRT